MSDALKKRFEISIQDTIQLRQKIIQSGVLAERTSLAVQAIVHAYRNGKKVLLAGNGGSAADAQHLAAEFVGRFYYDRAPLYAEALSTNSSDLTCIGNDYGFEHVFSRAVEGKGQPGDIFFAISTSGQSPNILKAAQAAKKKGMFVISLTGETGGNLAEYSDILLNIPSRDTARIQECHITIGHLICEFVESEIFPK